MSEVIVADNLGFCSGVERAIATLKEGAELSASLGLPCYVYGDIVHNKEVMASLAHYGIKSILSPEDTDRPGVIVIRAHGISDEMRLRFSSSGFRIIDATCPVVLKNQALVRDSDKDMIIIGYKEHAEVISLAGAAKREAIVIATAEELSSIDRNTQYNAVFQTTFSDSEYERIVSRIKEQGFKIRFLNSVCAASRMRRLSVIKLRQKVDAFVVVGDSMSANTKELAMIAGAEGCRVFAVEKAENLPPEVFLYSRIGVTAGASTPSVIYNKVIDILRSHNG